MLPIMEALATSTVMDAQFDYGSESLGSGIMSDGIISELLGLDDDDDEDDDDGKHDDKDDDHHDKGKGADDDNHGKDTPEAYDQVVEVNEDESIPIQLKGSGDDAVTFSSADEPKNGELSDFDESGGSVTYMP